MGHLNRLRVTLVTVVSAAVMSGTAVLGLGSAATAATVEDPITILGTCGQTFSPVISGAKAYWEVQCTSTSVRISGWVEDTASNGRCAKVKAIYIDNNNSTWFSAAACPKGDREYFTSPYRSGRNVNGYLYEYNV